MKQRVVVTGLGVLAPNAHGLMAFENALREGQSGIRFIEKLKELNFSCQVAGVPENIEILKHQYLSEEQLTAMNTSMIYAAIAAIDCWRDAGFEVITDKQQAPDWDTGAIIGTGIGGMDTIGEYLVPKIDAGKVRRLGSTMVEQIMASAPSANIGGLLGLGGQVTTNSSACTTGTEAIANAFYKIYDGHAKRMIAGGSEGSSYYAWGGFDGMRVLSSKFNEMPELASRPMSASACGFVPGSGAGLLMLESLESAQTRGARIYAEVLSAHINCGGQRGNGSITAPNSAGVIRCIQSTIAMANIEASEIDLINGHLTATMADSVEIANWQRALGCSPDKLPFVNSTKSLIGHGLGAAGGIECVAAILQLYKGFIHGSLNCDDLHPMLEPYAQRVVHKTRDTDARILAKSSFGFGDVNGCVLFKRWSNI